MFFKRAPKEIGLYYYKCANAGDILNETLINDLFGIRVCEESFTTSQMIAIGSILERIVSGSITGKRDKELQQQADSSEKITVWGTGMMHQYDDYSGMQFIRPVKFCAVRGELTRKAAENITGKKINCVTADPGLLAPLLLDEIPKKKYKLGIIPHVAEREMEEYKEMQSKTEGSVMIDLTKKPYEVLKQIAACETILSTSLHGLIFADSFGIPSCWCEMTDKILGKGYKYRDYYSAFGVAAAKPFDLRNGNFPTPDEIKSNYKISYDMVKEKQRALIKCFPYQNKNTRALLKSII